MKKKLSENMKKLSQAVSEPDEISIHKQAGKLLTGEPENKKNYEDIINNPVIDIPKNKVKPLNRRLFAIEVDPGEMKTEGGIILATSYKSNISHDDSKIIRHKRFFVVDVADDLDLMITDHNGKERRFQRFDEVFIFQPLEMENWTPAIIYDFYARYKYIMIEQMEIAGYSTEHLKNMKIIEED